mgnify:CR=1 FL=1
MATDKSKKAAKNAPVASDDGNEKKRALDIALAGIEKQFGKGAIIRMGERAVRDIEVIPTGYGAGRRRSAAWTSDRDLWSGILR